MKKKEKKGKGRKGSFLSSFHSTLQKGWEGNSPSRTFNEILLVVLHLAVSTKYIGSIYRPIVSIPFIQHSQNVKIKDDRGRKHTSASHIRGREVDVITEVASGEPVFFSWNSFASWMHLIACN